LLERGDETGVVEEEAHLVGGDAILETGLGDGARDVLTVLTIAGVRRVRARRENEKGAVAVVRRLRERVLQVRIPVAVAPVDRQVDAAPGEFALRRRLEVAVLLVARAHAPEMTVEMRDLLEALVRDAAPPGHVAEERDDVVLPLRATE